METHDRFRMHRTHDDWPAGELEREQKLRARLSEGPNDVAAFEELAELVRRHAAEVHEGEGFPHRIKEVNGVRDINDAVWALGEEIAQSSKAWYPLVQLARLSIDDDRETALRRLHTASERDASGQALALGLVTLRRAGHAEDALGLGVGYWRPAEHTPEAGRQLVEAAIETGRFGEARRHLQSLETHPDTDEVRRIVHACEELLEAAQQRLRDKASQAAGSGPGTRWSPLPRADR